ERYSYWISQLATANAEPRVKSLTLQPVMVGNSFRKEALSVMKSYGWKEINIPYLWGGCKVTILPPIGLTYRVERGTIKFDFEAPPSK
ncbi:MAG: hypothetical protein QXU81_10085, partial [Candidatus Bathyarchaeia archaeon]